MEGTFEDRVAELESQLMSAERAIRGIRSELANIQSVLEDIADEALGIAIDEFAHDPRTTDDYLPECEDIDAIYHEATDAAQTLQTLRRIFGALT